MPGLKDLGVRGLGSKSKQEQIFARLKSSNHTLFMLQETHSGEKTNTSWKKEWGNDAFWSGLLLFPSNIDFSKCRREIAASLNDFSNRWCKRENVEPDALKEWKINIFKIIDTRISFYSRNTHLLPRKPKSSFSHLKRGIQDFHMNYVLVPADKAANNVVVV